MTGKLTTKQVFWLEHIKAAKASGLGLKAYAQQQGLDPKALYRWKMTLGRKGLLERTHAFVEARVTQSPRPEPMACSVHVQLPNGARLQLPELSQSVLRWLAAL